MPTLISPGIRRRRSTTVVAGGGLLQTNLLAEFRFDEGTGQVLTDYAEGNHGQLGATSGADASDPTWAADGLSFDGTDDFVSANASGLLGGLTEFTLLAMIKGASQSDERYYSEGHSTLGNNPMFTFGSGVSDGSNIRVFGRRGDSTVFIDWEAALTAFDDTWNFVAFRRNGTAWRACVETDFASTTGGASAMDTTNDRISMGCVTRGSNSNFLTGSMGWLAKYSAALDDATILEIRTYALGVMAGK